jgi:hypothetical protein
MYRELRSCNRGEDVTYADEGGRIEVKSDSVTILKYWQILPMRVMCIAFVSIKNKGGEFALKNESRVMSLSKAFDEIPGFALICED